MITSLVKACTVEALKRYIYFLYPKSQWETVVRVGILVTWNVEVTDCRVVRTGISVTWNVLS